MCATCAGSQFPELLAWKPGERRPWVSLAHVLEGMEDGEPGCPYCAFFRALIGGGGKEGSGKFAPYFRIRQGFERLGVGERHELGKETLVEVMGRNKRLPWGYVVKAAEDEGRSMEGYLSEEKVIRGRIISPTLSVDLVRLWLDYCEEHHQDAKKGCLRRRGLPEGVRLLDVQKRQVVNVDELEGIVPDYVTLSYGWGEHEQWGESPTDDNKLPEDIPPLISDALDFTAALGFNYLWIDRYCHRPLPPHLQYLHLDHMGDIFAQSALTLIVASGTSVADGIPGLSIPRDPQLSLKTETGLYTTTLLRPDLAVGSSKWQSRGWTYQEGLMARRRLVFTNSQVYFQCQTLHCHESLSIPLKYAPGLNLGRVFPENGPGQGGEDVKNHIKAYISKDFSQPEERLQAFRGVLRHFKAEVEKPVDSLLGLPFFNHEVWESDKVVSQTDRLVVALGWVHSLTRPSEIPTNPYKLSKEYPFPSWTWLSWSLREGYTPNFGFNLVPNEASIQGISAPPKMEISVGFEDSTLLSWEIDEDAIRRRKEEDIRFLKLKGYVFSVVVTKEGQGVVVGGNVILGRVARESMKSWFKASAEDEELSDGEYELVGILINGKGWKEAGEKEVSVLVCNWEGWPKKEAGGKDPKEETNEEEEQPPETNGLDEGRRLKRLGVLTLSYQDFTPVDDENAVMEGMELDKGDRGDLAVELREVDIY